MLDALAAELMREEDAVDELEANWEEWLEGDRRDLDEDSASRRSANQPTFFQTLARHFLGLQVAVSLQSVQILPSHEAAGQQHGCVVLSGCCFCPAFPARLGPDCRTWPQGRRDRFSTGKLERFVRPSFGLS